MPVYEYRASDTSKACDRCRKLFEVQQSMKDDPIETCPECDNPVERVVSLCSVSTSQSTKSMLSNKNLKDKGFTKLVNEGDGKFRNVTK